jgi:hypothetical protein
MRVDGCNGPAASFRGSMPRTSIACTLGAIALVSACGVGSVGMSNASDQPSVTHAGGGAAPIVESAAAGSPTRIASTGSASSGGAPTPPVVPAGLVGPQHFTYLGAFALPQDPVGTSRFGYGGRALAPYRDPRSGKLTLFMEGHAHREGQVAQIEVPVRFVKSPNRADLPMATVLQPFADVTDGELGRRPNSLGNAQNGSPVYGLLPYNNRLIVAATMYYDTAQNATHGVSSLQLSDSSDFRGFFAFDPNSVAAPPRALGGAMSLVPIEMRDRLGGPAVTGNQSVPLIGASSSGPSLTVFDPDDVGRKSPIPGRTLLYYPLSNPLCGSLGCESAKNPIFNQTTIIRGRAIPSGSNSVLFIGKHGVGEYWYGGSVSPEGVAAAPGSEGWGPKSSRFEYRVWAYRVDDLVAVRSGQKKPWAIQPYGIWALPEVSGIDPGPELRGVGYDDESGLLFLAPAFGEQGRIEVLRISRPQ